MSKLRSRTLPRHLALGSALAVFGALGPASTPGSAQSAAQTTSRNTPQRGVAVSRPATDSSFARLIQRLSESGGFFDSDNLISNESSYLHVLGGMSRLGVRGGAYVGVGPDQNFSYITRVRPSIALLIDIRRDNLLQHFMFKALFEMAANRAEFLCLLFGRPVPRDAARWQGRTVEQLIAYIDATPAQPRLAAQTAAAIRARTIDYRLPLSQTDLETIARIYDSFVSAGMDLRFTSANRPPRPWYPTYRQLLLETDLSGKRANYLVTENDFQFLKGMQERNLIVPVVGDLAGDRALAAIGAYIAGRGEKVSAFYTSNVEFYLFRDGSFDRFVKNVGRLPHDGRSVIIRSYFGGPFREPHPRAVAGYYSTQLLQTVESLLADHAAGGYPTYWDLITKHTLELK